MIRIFTLFTVLIIIVNTSNAAFNESKEEEKETFYTTSPVVESTIVEMITNLNRKEFEKLTGHHLNLRERIAFAFVKHKARYPQKQEKTKGFNLGGFALGFSSAFVGFLLAGFLVGLPGLLVCFAGLIGALSFSKDKNFIRWSFWGTLVGSVFYIIFILLWFRGYE